MDTKNIKKKQQNKKDHNKCGKDRHETGLDSDLGLDCRGAVHPSALGKKIPLGFPPTLTADRWPGGTRFGNNFRGLAMQYDNGDGF